MRVKGGRVVLTLCLVFPCSQQLKKYCKSGINKMSTPCERARHRFHAQTSKAMLTCRLLKGRGMRTRCLNKTRSGALHTQRSIEGWLGNNPHGAHTCGVFVSCRKRMERWSHGVTRACAKRFSVCAKQAKVSKARVAAYKARCLKRSGPAKFNCLFRLR